jgi:hypothetical protein
MPKTSAQRARELARQSTDCSFLLTHLIRQNGDHPKSDRDARATLLAILGLAPAGSPTLRGAPVGWYSAISKAHGKASCFDPVSRTFGVAGAHRAVCFTESTLGGLNAHRAVFNVRYGVAFDRDWLFARGANPCLNIRAELLKAQIRPAAGERYPRAVFNFIPEALHAFVNIINESFDATHEREWRYAGDLPFAPGDLRFVFCPEDDFPTFSAIQRDARPTLFDLDWLDRV